MTAILTDVTENTTGAAVEFTAPTTVFLEGGLAIVTLQARVPTKGWIEIYKFGEPVVSVNIEGTYELRGIVESAGTGTNVTLNAT